ncbi:MAG: type II toxin-antitoxin system VapC family toxin [Anaerolineaceae bacterium]|nr:type II toxin-antitoxin system VapC family toxin [Anaerolineaceae bacterium]
MGDCIVDASVGIKLFLAEAGSDEAHRLFAELAAETPSRFYVPDLFFVECGNILWKYVRHFGYPAESARQDVADLQALKLQTVSTADLLTPAFNLAVQYDLTAYDACYAALAQQLALPLITADGPLVKKLTGSGIEAISLT